MGDEEKFDAIVVGAGPAGIACAYTLAKEGREVVVVERGDVPGAKNMTGGRVYTYALEQVEPGLAARAQDVFERRVTHEQMMMLDGDRGMLLSYSDPTFAQGEGVPLSYTVLRARFDEWFAAQAEEAGAMMVCGVRVDGLIEKDGRVVGVRAGEDEMFADVVVAADGVSSFMAQSIGLASEIGAKNVCVGAKEIIELPAKTIEERFGCSDGNGAARLIVGGCDGVNGGAFIYTNRESVSVGCVLMPQALTEKQLSVADAVQRIKLHPAIAPLLEGGRTVEYSAHLCPEAGIAAVPQHIAAPGVLLVGDAAGLVINQGYTVRGIDLAILSGVAAARTVLSASAHGAEGADASDEAVYRAQLDMVGVTRAMQMARRFPEVEDNPRIFGVYPELLCNVFDTVYRIDPMSDVPLYPKLKECVRASTSFGGLLKDAKQIRSTLKQGK